MQSKKISLYKSITWRIIAITIGLVITYMFTGNIEISLNIAILSNIIAIFVFYYHERLWDKVEVC